MSDEMDWARIRGEDPQQVESKKQALRMTLFFGAAAVVLGIFATPLLDRNNNANQKFNFLNGNIDPFITASTRSNTPKSYTIRRSVLQNSPEAKCIIQPNGTATGDC